MESVLSVATEQDKSFKTSHRDGVLAVLKMSARLFLSEQVKPVEHDAWEKVKQKTHTKGKAETKLDVASSGNSFFVIYFCSSYKTNRFYVVAHLQSSK